MISIRQRSLVIFLYTLLGLFFVIQRWIPYYESFVQLNNYTFFNWEKQVIFLLISFIIKILLTIILGSLFAIILNRHHCNIEFATMVGAISGIVIGGSIMLILVMFGMDIAGIRTIFITTTSGFALGIFQGIKKEVEDDERVC